MKSIFISGGCGGFGLAVARVFRNEGYIVGLGDLRPPADESILGDGITFYELDVTKPESWDAALSEFTKLTGGRLDILDNNAGIIDSATIAESDPNRICAVIDVNALGVTLGARAAYPYLRKTPGSQLINIASIAGCYGIPDVGVYAATKAYVQSMTETLDLEWRRDKIRVLDINPLWAKTPISDVKSKTVARLGVNLTPDDVAQAIWRAANPKNRWGKGRLHWGVGAQDKAARVARNMMPDRVAKLIYQVLST
ncbi:SDR family oxidoreductase [Corynebacterium striatum]|uniref:SDR family oxidoreductase n=1 Tax=Corynebacterium striatum TaxID=43770 RepID=UPI003EC93FEF